MLRLILGRSGSGKSYTVTERLAALAAAGESGLLLLVPEQHSFVSERTLLRRLGPAGAAQVAVLSFTRLAQTVFREVGGLAGEPLDEGARALLMSRALAEAQEELRQKHSVLECQNAEMTILRSLARLHAKGIFLS